MTYGALSTSIAAVLSIELFGLHVLVTLLAFGQVFHNIVNGADGKLLSRWAPLLNEYVNDWSWVAIVFAAGYLLILLIPTRKSAVFCFKSVIRPDSTEESTLPPVTTSMR